MLSELSIQSNFVGSELGKNMLTLLFSLFQSLGSSSIDQTQPGNRKHWRLIDVLRTSQPSGIEQVEGNWRVNLKGQTKDTLMSGIGIFKTFGLGVSLSIMWLFLILTPCSYHGPKQ